MYSNTASFKMFALCPVMYPGRVYFSLFFSSSECDAARVANAGLKKFVTGTSVSFLPPETVDISINYLFIRDFFLCARAAVYMCAERSVIIKNSGVHVLELRARAGCRKKAAAIALKNGNVGRSSSFVFNLVT
jgi:hypothetical protein